MPTAAERLAEARAYLAAGKPRKAGRSAWRELMAAVRFHDVDVFVECQAFATDLAAATTGKERADAELLGKYATACLDGAATGTAPSFLDRLLGRSPRVRLKRCPDCAESIQQEARVCRFCGARLEPTV